MTFKKNLFTVLAVVIFVIVAAYLVGIPQEFIVYGAAFLIPAGILILATEDLMRKWFTDREKLTWQYFVGFLIILCAMGVFIWAVEATKNINFFTRLGLAVFSGSLGFWWFYGYYRKSLQNSDEKVTERWSRTVRRLKKAKTPEKASKIYNQTLKYHLVDNSPFADLNLSIPLNDMRMTYEELMSQDPEEVQSLKNLASEYIKILVDQMEFKVPVLEEDE